MKIEDHQQDVEGKPWHRHGSIAFWWPPMTSWAHTDSLKEFAVHFRHSIAKSDNTTTLCWGIFEGFEIGAYNWVIRFYRHMKWALVQDWLFCKHLTMAAWTACQSFEKRRTCLRKQQRLWLVRKLRHRAFHNLHTNTITQHVLFHPIMLHHSSKSYMTVHFLLVAYYCAGLMDPFYIATTFFLSFDVWWQNW